MLEHNLYLKREAQIIKNNNNRETRYNTAVDTSLVKVIMFDNG